MKIENSEVVLKSKEVVSLRSPEAEDALPLLDFVRTLHHESSENLLNAPNHFDDFTEEEERKIILSRLQSMDSFFMGAFFDGRVVGHLGLHREPGSLHQHCGIFGMGILKPFQGKGLGNHLMSRAIEEASSIGINNLMLRVRTFNESAIISIREIWF